MARRKGAWARLQDHFHTHPKGRFHEIVFWVGLGLVMGAFALFGWRSDAVSTPIALILTVVALCLVGWGFLPPTPQKVAPPKPGRLRNRDRR